MGWWRAVSKNQGGRSSVVEFQPSKLAVVGSNPIARSIYRALLESSAPVLRTDRVRRQVRVSLSGAGLKAHVAQLVEHVLGKDEVTRSIRVVGSTSRLLGRGKETRYGEGEV